MPGPNLASRVLLAGEPADAWHMVRVIQPCIRYWDMPQVGDGTHLSFFEMAMFARVDARSRPAVLRDLLATLRDGYGLDPEGLWATVYGGGAVAGQTFAPDREAAACWRRAGVAEGRIVEVLGAEGFVANRHEPVGGYRTELYCDVGGGCLGGGAYCRPSLSTCGRFIESGRR